MIEGDPVTMIDLVGFAVAVTALAYVVCRAAAAGWFAGKLAYQRKLMHLTQTGEG